MSGVHRPKISLARYLSFRLVFDLIHHNSYPVEGTQHNGWHYSIHIHDPHFRLICSGAVLLYCIVDEWRRTSRWEMECCWLQLSLEKVQKINYYLRIINFCSHRPHCPSF